MAIKLDLLAFGPHPDDCEIGAGAFLLKMKKKGYKTGMVSLTEGDMGRGTPEIRKKETSQAAKLLQVDIVEILNMGDCKLEDNFENRIQVAGIIRKYKPRILLAPFYGIEPSRGRGHADHIACGHLVAHGANFAHLEKFPAEGKPHSVRTIMYYFISSYEKPTIIVPVDEELPVAGKAIAKHRSQFGNRPKNKSLPDALLTFGRFYGMQIGSLYGQPFYLADILRMDDPVGFFVTTTGKKVVGKKRG